jgi:hypothetical protein
MISIAPNKILELLQTVGIRGHHAGFIEDQHACFVAGVEQLGCGRVMRGAQSVAARLLQFPQAVVLHGIGQCNSKSGVILMVTGALQFHAHAVEQESLIGVELYGANPKNRLKAIHGPAVHLNFGQELVPVSLFK